MSDEQDVFPAPVDFDNNDEPVMDYRQTLNYTQRIRKELVKEQTKGGVPADKDGVELLLKTLKDMDGTAINDRRNTIDEGNADNARKVADAMTTYFRENQNPFRVSDDGDYIPSPPTVNRGKLPKLPHADGETHIGTISETSEEFNARMEQRYQDHFDSEEDSE